MSAKRLYEQTWATLRKKQRGMDGRVKKHKRQRKQILSLSLSLSLSPSFFLFSFYLFLSMLLSPYFLLGWPPLFMTNTLTLHVFCIYFLFPFSLFLCLLFVLVLTSAKGIPLHSAAMPIAISYTPEQCQHHLLTLITVFCCCCLGGWCCSRVEPAYQSWIVGRVTYSLPLGRSISSPLLYKI